MKKVKLDRVPSVEVYNSILFGQVLLESLYSNTIDSHKAPSTNIHSNVRELISIFNGIRKGTIHESAINAVFSEISTRILTQDWVKALNICELQMLHECIKGKKSHDAIYAQALIASSFLEKNLFSLLKKSIVDNIYTENSNIVVSLAMDFAIEAENCGYHRTYTYFAALNSIFVRRVTVDPVSVLESFFDRFDGSEGDFTYYFAAPDSYLELGNVPGRMSVVALSEMPHDVLSFTVDKFIPRVKSPDVYVQVGGIEAKDAYFGRLTALEFVGLFCDFYSLYTHSELSQVDGTCVCKNEVTGEVRMLLQAPDPDNISLLRSATDGFSYIGNIDSRRNDIIIPFMKAIKLHRISQETHSVPIKFTTLWTAVEAFLPKPKGGKSKIEEYVQNVCSLLSLMYAKKVLTYNSDFFKKSCSDVCDAIAFKLGADRYGLDAFAKFICCEEYGDLRDSVSYCVSDYPIVRYKIKILNNKFGSPKKILETISEHKERLGIHLQRIYISRNYITHDADEQRYLFTLTTNLHSYLDEILAYTLKTAHEMENIDTRSDLFGVAAAKQRTYEKMLSGIKMCTVDNYKTVLNL
ncbi:MAG: hypothetical protein LBU75_16450 [Desulfovibrio sp.]|jgi:hypothetical protein|nr:hypothetical protein [Desulfovibrio sp.]